MPLSRLLALAMLLTLSTANLTAQSRASDLSAPAASPADQSSDLFSVLGADQSHFTLYPQLDFTLQNSPTDAEPAGAPVLFTDESGRRHFRSDVRDLSAESQDATCYAIRSYVVVRDSPHSDATHAGSYSTCVAASRVRMYTTAAREQR